jgi:hypothetical protein
MADEVQIGVRVPKALHDAIEAIATREHRTVSGQVRAWLTDAVETDRQRQRDRRAQEDRLERDRWGEP